MGKSIFIVLLFSLAGIISNGQQLKSKSGLDFPRPVCYASDKIERTFIPPSESFLLKSGEPKSNIEVNYISFPTEARIAFEHAVGIWESIIESDVTIRMVALWSDDLEDKVLGSCGPETYYANFPNAPYDNVFYAVALAEKIANKELNGDSRYDIVANFSSKINWYFGIDGGSSDDQYDFVSVVLHEIAHGLGFTGFFFVNNTIGGYGYFNSGDIASFDQLIVNSSGTQLLDPTEYPIYSRALGDALQSERLYAHSPVAMNANNGYRPRLYAPAEYDGGSSIYHLNESTYPAGTPNSLMTYAIGRSEAIHDPGPLTQGIMEDIGWSSLTIHFDPPKDKEIVQPIVFNASFESDYALDSSALYVIYSTDGFQSQSDTLKLVSGSEDGMFSATLVPDENTNIITYYVEANDVKNRIKYSPSLAPNEYHQVKFGPDTEQPVISHTPINYFLNNGNSLELTAEVDDNLGIDTVYVEYWINTVLQPAFGLTLKEGDTYSAEFPFNLETLNDGDSIYYKIYAVDSSAARNMVQHPETGEILSFNVEGVFEPVNQYITDFNSQTPDFLIFDFDIYTANNFENGALHSPHPYPNPGVDNEDYNFSTLLKHPIIINESGTMTYDEVVLVEPGGYDDYNLFQLWDYVIVEGSKDLGETWLPLVDGYDSGDNALWEQSYNSSFSDMDSRAIGKSEWFKPREISLLQNENFEVGDTILLRFRLYSDPYATGWGWAIDNLSIQQPLSAGITGLSEDDVKIYPNPFNNIINLQLNSDESIDELKLEVFNLFGQVVYSLEERSIFGYLNKEIDLSQLGSGIFLVKLSESGKQVYSKKLIKN